MGWAGVRGGISLRTVAAIRRALCNLILPEPVLELPFSRRGLRPAPSSRALLLSVFFHSLLAVAPLAGLTAPSAPVPAPATVRVELDLQWVQPSRLLPPITPARRLRSTPPARTEPRKPAPAPAPATVAAQTIVSNPPEPNHPRQTLQHSLALDHVRVRALDLKLPNVVLAHTASPSLQLEPTRFTPPPSPAPLAGKLPASSLPRPKTRAELALESTRLDNLMPRLTLPAPVEPRRVAAGPEVNVSVAALPRSGRGGFGLLALSATPAPPRPMLELPKANLRARFAVGPGADGGTGSGLAGGTGEAGGGVGGLGAGGDGLVVPDILVTPVGETPAGPVVVGPQASPAPRAPSPPAPPRSPEERARTLQHAASSGASESGRAIYTTYVFLENLTSQSSSWLVRFAEPGQATLSSTSAHSPNPPPENDPVAPPRVLRKVDPCYPAHTNGERVEGKVVLYAVIRTDGGVEDVVVVEGINPQVDKRAAQALARSRFQPARKHGRPLAVEALLEIPFRLARCF